MKSYWLTKLNNKKLIVFFAGWSFDENPFKSFIAGNVDILSREYPEYDVLMIYDYNEFSVPEELKNCLQNYENKFLISWSMGVFSAYLLRDLFADFDYKLAINGTVTPVDNDFGIPVRMFELTLKHAQKGLEGKFYKNVFLTDEEFDIYSKSPVQRSIDNRVLELENLYEVIKNTDINYEKFYDRAIVSEFDKIIPSKNQIASHEKNNVPIVSIPSGHAPFYYFSSWDEIIKCK